MLIISVLEVYQFARDASVAEAWLMAQDPYLNNQDLGVSLMQKYDESISCRFYFEDFAS